MLFNSWSYILFVLIAIPLSYMVKGKVRIYLLLLLSLLFYGMWRWDFMLLMLFSALIDFISAKKIFKAVDRKSKLFWLTISLFINLSLLLFFKYTYFINDNISTIVSWLGGSFEGLNSQAFTIVLPLGISFYTFQTISYSIDVYRGHVNPINDFPLFATYVTFWPQLVAGPILRASEVIPQLETSQKFSWENLDQGFWRVVVGLFKKVVLADNITTLVDEGFLTNPNFLTAWDVWILIFLFGLQIYFDFSGYSDIAIGTARMMGIRFPENFNWPYLAQTPREFWRCWHISLSSWIRDYLYLPIMGGKVRGKSEGGIDIAIANNSKLERPVLALFLTWFIMGLWHGAGWNFVIWGLYHAVAIYTFRKMIWIDLIEQKAKWILWGPTFLLMMASWIPFRSNSVQQTVELFSIVINPFRYSFADNQFHISYYFYAITILSIMFLLYQLKKAKIVQGYLDYLRWSVIPVLTFFIIVYMQQIVQFIYFQF